MPDYDLDAALLAAFRQRLGLSYFPARPASAMPASWTGH